MADMMGHAKVDTQYLFYVQGSEERKRGAADTLGNKLHKIAQDLENEPALVH